MSIRDLFFRISAKDETAGAFATVKKNMQEVEGAARGLRDRLQSAGRSMRNIGAGLSAAVTAPLVLAGRNMLHLYQVQEKAEAQVAQAIRQTGAAAGFTAAELFKEASALQELTAVGDEQILGDVTAQLLTFGNISGETFKRAQVAALDLSATLGSNLKSQTIQLGKALKDPIRGISALGKAGIQFTEDQKAVIKSLVETGRIAEAQGLILDEIAAFYGGQASTSAQTLTGQLTALGNAWGDLQEQFGAIIAEFLPPIISGLRAVVAALQEMPEPMRRFIVAAAAMVAAVGPVLGVLGLLALGLAALPALVVAVVAGVAALAAALVAFWPNIVAAAEAVREGFLVALGAVREWAGQAVEYVRGLVASFLEANPQIVAAFEMVREGLTAGLAAVAEFWNQTRERVAGIVDEALAVIGDFATRARDYVAEMVSAIWNTIRQGFDRVVGYVTRTVERIAGAFDWLYNEVVGNSSVPDLVEGVLGEFNRLESGAVGTATSAAEGVAGVFSDLGDQVVGVFADMVRSGNLSLKSLGQGLLGIGSSIAGNIANQGISYLSGLASSAISGALGSAFPSIFATTRAPFGWTPASASSFGLRQLNEGADFTVGGRGGIDQNLVQFMATRGERVTVTPRNGAGPSPAVNVTINTPSPDAFAASRGQVAATISRAVARGQRNL